MPSPRDSSTKSSRKGRTTSAHATRGSGQRLSLSDPLDAAGARPNPMTGAPYSAARAKWAAVWSKFPLYADKPKMRALVKSFRENNVTIVVSGTGSGKTVLAVPLMLQVVSSRPGAGQAEAVAVTIPKRTTVLAAAQTGAMTLDVPLGAQVGYQFRGAPDGASSGATRLLYSTDGTLLAQSRRDPLLSKFAAVVVDEAHERPLPTDLLLVALRGALAQRPEMRLAVMSATIDPAEFVRYFEGAGLSVGVVQVAGSPMHPIERRFLGQPSRPLQAGLEVVRGVLADGRTSGNVLLFVPLTRDTVEGCREIDGKDAQAPPTCVPVYGKMSADERDAAVAPRTSRPGHRRVFVATNVAESSLTIPDLLDVVDTGLQLVSEYDAATHGTRIAREMATQAQITQRIGRAGRTAPGVAHLLYTQAQLEAQPLFPKPAILSADLSQTLLEEIVATSGVRGPAWFLANLITPPTIDQLTDAAMTLHFYGLVDVRPRGGSPESLRRFPDMPYATLRYPHAGAQAQQKAVVTNALASTLHSHEFAPTHFGRVVAGVMQRMRLGLPYALLLAAGVACGCARDAAQLAVLLESVGGELRSLWIEGGGKIRPANVPKGCASSDHAAIATILRDLLAAKEVPQLLALGLAPGPWLAARRAVLSVRGQIEALEQPDSELARAIRATCPEGWRRGAGLGAAVLASRGFNAAVIDKSGKSATTVHTLRPVTAEIPPMMPGSTYPGGHPCVFEALTMVAGGSKLSGVTVAAKQTPPKKKEGAGTRRKRSGGTM